MDPEGSAIMAVPAMAFTVDPVMVFMAVSVIMAAHPDLHHSAVSSVEETALALPILCLVRPNLVTTFPFSRVSS